MNGLNKAYLIGNLGHDPKLRATASGLAIVKLSLATKHAKKVNEQWTESLDWHRVTAFGKEAAYLSRMAHKGDVLAVECAIRPREWTDKEDKVRHEVDLIVERVLWLSTPRRATADESSPLDEHDLSWLEEPSS